MVHTDYEPDRGQLSAWQAALQRQADALRAEIQAKHAQLTQIDQRLELVRRLVELPEAGLTSSPPRPPVDPIEGNPTVEPSRLAADGEFPELEAAVIKILRHEGAPLHISEIRRQLLERGVAIPGRGDDANIIVRLSRTRRFTRTARGTYGLVEWGLPRLPSRPSRKRGRTR
jgi:HB1, ASXL, restriction endonuclease HTH domain